MWWEEAVLRDRWDLESKASFWEVLESSNSEIVANYITFAASNYCRGQDTTERQTPRATESGRNYKAGRRKINQRQLRGSRSKHILGNTKSLGSSTLRDFHWGAAHFPSQSPLYRWDLDGQAIFHAFAQLTAHKRLSAHLQKTSACIDLRGLQLLNYQVGFIS